MSKKKITPRGELVKLARELKPDIAQDVLMPLLDKAMATATPEEFIRERLAVTTGSVAHVGDEVDLGSAVGDQKSEVSDREGEAPAEPYKPATYGEFAAGIMQSVAVNLGIPAEVLLHDIRSNGDIAREMADTSLPLSLSPALFFPNLAGMPCSGNKTRHVDLQLTRHPLAREVLTRLRHRLHQDHVTTLSHRHVDNPSQAIVWILEQIGLAMGIDRELAGTAPGTAAVDIGMNATPLDAALEQAATAVGAAE